MLDVSAPPHPTPTTQHEVQPPQGVEHDGAEAAGGSSSQSHGDTEPHFSFWNGVALGILAGFVVGVFLT